jgi:predicted membrane protein
MVACSNLCLFGVINGGVVHGRGFESLTLWGQWSCSACRGFEYLIFGVNSGVVHGPGFEYLTLWESMVV